ncbi:MAG TPA: alkaline phosphatase family protein [Alphaproteobacteria bacterium]|nr:alkaline phosphatase family protein [Alphaproteobacteria bacterium]
MLTWDEGGGLYDHVSPQPMPSPDGIAPKDLRANDICLNTDGSINSSPTCNFMYTGYRLPLVVISPFTKKNYVSHTVADYTAILKLIETRFNLHSLTARDAAQMDMTEFFDFNAAPWKTPSTPPDQITTGACYLDHLP